jgi:pyridinium-3,5-biscarboxylic acid mononucleotide synthase
LESPNPKDRTTSFAELAELLRQVEQGSYSREEFVERVLAVQGNPTSSLNIDTDRARRCSMPEVIYGSGKSTDVLLKAVEHVLAIHDEALITRIDPQAALACSKQFPFSRHDSVARTFRARLDKVPLAPDQVVVPTVSSVAVVSAGTTDMAVALEAVETLAWFGVPSQLIQDVGVAGPYRLIARVSSLRRCAAVIVVAGMEGALPSVVGGQVGVPVIAVPTSVGYGTSFGGLTALLGMLNSCAANVTVVNIDAGFKAAYVAGLIALKAKSNQ